MKHIKIGDIGMDLTEEQVLELKRQINEGTEMSAIAPGEVFELAGHEFIILEQLEEGAAVLLKGLWRDEIEFRDSGNNFDGSIADDMCKEFEEELKKATDQDIFVMHSVDLTSDDGLKDYGVIERNVSLLTAEQYRKYVEILDIHKLDAYWWLSTPHSTKTHNNDCWIKCVAPSGSIDDGNYFNYFGVRPFCILKSNIFVSKKGE